MRLFIRCKSPLLQKTLDLYLKEYKTDDISICDFCVSDVKIKNKRTFIIAKDIKHPFTKENLIRELKSFLNKERYFEIKEDLTKTIRELKKEQSKKIDSIAKRLK